MRFTPPGRRWMGSTSTMTCSKTTGDRRSTPTSARCRVSRGAWTAFRTRLSARANRSSIKSCRRTSAPGSSSSKPCGRGNATRTSTPIRWPRAWPRRRSSPTRPKPSVPAACSRSCARCRGSCRRRATTSPSPPAIYVKVGIDTWRGAMSFIDADLPRAFSGVDDMHLLGDLADACTEAVTTIGAYVTDLETDIRPKAKGSFRLGRDRFEQKLRLEEGITLPIEKLLAIATRELEATQEEFRQLAGRLNGGDPMKVWREAKDKHPRAGHADRDRARTARRAAHLPVAQPRGADARERRCGGGADAGIFPLGHGQHVDAGPVRVQAVARDVLPDRRRSEVGGRAAERSTCATSTCRRCGRFRSTRSTRATTCTTSASARWNRRCAARRCSRRPPTWRAGRITASR